MINENRAVHMTSKRNKIHISLLVTFQLFAAFQSLVVPLAARNIKSPAYKSNQSEILVIMSSGTNVTSIYSSFNDFRKMFGVEFPDDRRIAFKNGEGKLTFTFLSYLIIDFSENLLIGEKFFVD